MLLLVYFIMYVAYISVILVWWILGAVLNPEKFLPMATGAIVIIGFTAFLYSRLKQIDQTLQEVVNITVNQELRVSLYDSIQKNSDLSKVARQVESIPQMLFNKAINAYMSANNHPIVERNITDEILQGNAGAIANLIHKNWGIDYNISLGLVGLLKNDPVILLGKRLENLINWLCRYHSNYSVYVQLNFWYR